MSAEESSFANLFGTGRKTMEPLGSTGSPDDLEEINGPDFNAPYKAAGAYRGKGLTTLWVYFNAGERKTSHRRKRQFQYRNLDDDDAQCGMFDDGTGFSVIFSGQTRQRLIVRGRGGPLLEEIYDRITMHRLPWIRSLELERDFLEDRAAVITSISIEMLQDEEIQGFVQLK